MEMVEIVGRWLLSSAVTPLLAWFGLSSVGTSLVTTVGGGALLSLLVRRRSPTLVLLATCVLGVLLCHLAALYYTIYVVNTVKLVGNEADVQHACAGYDPQTRELHLYCIRGTLQRHKPLWLESYDVLSARIHDSIVGGLATLGGVGLAVAFFLIGGPLLLQQLVGRRNALQWRRVHDKQHILAGSFATADEVDAVGVAPVDEHDIQRDYY